MYFVGFVSAFVVCACVCLSVYFSLLHRALCELQPRPGSYLSLLTRRIASLTWNTRLPCERAQLIYRALPAFQCPAQTFFYVGGERKGDIYLSVPRVRQSKVQLTSSSSPS